MELDKLWEVIEDAVDDNATRIIQIEGIKLTIKREHEIFWIYYSSIGCQPLDFPSEQTVYLLSFEHLTKSSKEQIKNMLNHASIDIPLNNERRCKEKKERLEKQNR